MKKYPIRKIKLDVEALGGVIELHELSIRYKELCNADSSHDTVKNGLMDAGMTEEQYLSLSEQTSVDIMNDVIDLTFPNARAELQRMIEEGTFVPPTEEEKEASKKN